MKLSRSMITAVAAVLLLAAPAMAGSGGHDTHGKMMKHQDTIMEHTSMMHDNMVMMKEVMGILRDLNHTPTPEQKKRLTVMMGNMDKMMNKMMGMHE